MKKSEITSDLLIPRWFPMDLRKFNGFYWLKSILLYGCQYVSWFLCHLMIAQGVQWRWHSWLKHLDDLTNVTPGNDMGMLPAARQANHQVGMSRFGPQGFCATKNHMGPRHSMKNQTTTGFPSKKNGYIRFVFPTLRNKLPQPGRPSWVHINDGRNPSGSCNNLHSSYLLIFLLLWFTMWRKFLGES